MSKQTFMSAAVNIVKLVNINLITSSNLFSKIEGFQRLLLMQLLFKDLFK